MVTFYQTHIRYNNQGSERCLRQAFISPGIDEQKMRTEAEARGGHTFIHRHKFGEVCNGGCYIWPSLENEPSGAG